MVYRSLESALIATPVICRPSNLNNSTPPNGLAESSFPFFGRHGRIISVSCRCTISIQSEVISHPDIFTPSLAFPLAQYAFFKICFMDPLSLAAVGLTGNIIQFLGFGCKLVSKARVIQEHGSVIEHRDLEITTKDLELCAEAIRNGLSVDRIATLGDSEVALHDISNGCLEIARELQVALEKLRSNRKMTRWKSLQQALKSMVGKERIAELKARLDLYAKQMDRRVLLSLV